MKTVWVTDYSNQTYPKNFKWKLEMYQCKTDIPAQGHCMTEKGSQI